MADVLLTLLSRARRKQPLFEAHREHVYQLWLVANQMPHLALAWRMGAIMATFALAALAAQAASPAGQPLVFLLALAVSVSGWSALRRRLTRRG